jgi:hypothetical protein
MGLGKESISGNDSGISKKARRKKRQNKEVSNSGALDEKF